MAKQKRRKTITRLALARRLQSIALALAADRPVRVGNRSVRVPERVTFEQEIEISGKETELEFEITWLDSAIESPRKSPSGSKKRAARKRS